MYVNWRQGSQFCAELQWVLSCDRAAITSPLQIDGSDLLRLQNFKDKLWVKPWLLPLTNAWRVNHKWFLARILGSGPEIEWYLSNISTLQP